MRQTTFNGMNTRICSGAAGVPTLSGSYVDALQVGTPRRLPQTQSPRPIAPQKEFAKLLCCNIHHEHSLRSCCGAATGGVRRTYRSFVTGGRQHIDLQRTPNQLIVDSPIPGNARVRVA